MSNLKTCMMKKIVLGAFFVLLMDVIAVLALASNPISEGPDTFNGPCYQTMGYCGHVLTYKCTKDYTSEQCHRHVCDTCEKIDEPIIE